MNENPNLAVITSRQIIEQSMPILYVSYDEDGYWQFLSRFEKDEKDGRIVRMEEILELDKSLSHLSILIQGMEAYRKDINSEWIINVRSNNEEESSDSKKAEISNSLSRLLLRKVKEVNIQQNKGKFKSDKNGDIIREDNKLNKAAFTVREIIYGAKKILLIIHNQDDEWQFLAGDEISMKELMVVTVKQILEIDKSLNDILGLPPSMEAYRKDVNSKWETRVRKNEEG